MILKLYSMVPALAKIVLQEIETVALDSRRPTTEDDD